MVLVYQISFMIMWCNNNMNTYKPAYHCPIITESEGSGRWFNWMNCFDPIVLIPLPDCQAKFLSDSEKLPPIV